jgi:replicative DNA helicase
MLARSERQDRAAQSPLFREAPHNIDCEQGLLGAILINNGAFARVEEFLHPEHFYDPLHAQIFETIAILLRAGKIATPVTLQTFFEASEPLSPELTVPQYLGRLAAAATTIINVSDYGRTVQELAQRRSLIALGEELVNAAYEAPIDFPPATIIVETEQRLGELARTGDEDRVSSFGAVMTGVIEQANDAYQRDGHLAGLATGLADLDNKMGGLANSDLIILAGRPSMGKTALATNIAWNIAKSFMPNGDGELVLTPVDFYSLEMKDTQLGARILANESGIPSEKVRRGMITEDEFRKLVHSAERIAKTPLTIDHRGGISIDQFCARARRQQRRTGSRLIVVDYLQLMRGGKYSGKNRVQEVTEITTGLKALAKELDVPIIALSQLSRDLEKREDKRPMLSDLRDSGSIEQDADVVIFVYRDEYYIERRKPAENEYEKFNAWQSEMVAASGKAEAIIAKQRMGPIGTVQLAFDSALTTFSNLAKEYQLPERYE